MHPAGVEPATLGSEDRCSIQLSYGCLRFSSTYNSAVYGIDSGCRSRQPDATLASNQSGTVWEMAPPATRLSGLSGSNAISRGDSTPRVCLGKGTGGEAVKRPRCKGGRSSVQRTRPDFTWRPSFGHFRCRQHVCCESTLLHFVDTNGQDSPFCREILGTRPTEGCPCYVRVSPSELVKSSSMMPRASMRR